MRVRIHALTESPEQKKPKLVNTVHRADGSYSNVQKLLGSHLHVQLSGLNTFHFQHQDSNWSLAAF